ncbi:MAG: CoA transferase [Proteobacteria bacterium]|nr:CoA transferase [Pseudomonadota bacterium]
MHAGRAVFHTFQNSDKRSLVLDLDSAEQRDTLRRLIGTCDVLIENLRPGALARKGLGPNELLALNPRLIICAISGFGIDSHYAGRPAFDTVVQAMSGLMHLIRSRDIPLKTGPSIADVMGAAFAATAVMAALEWRERSGQGQFIDVAMQDICAWATQTAWNHAPAVAAPGVDQLPILTTFDVVGSPQTLARKLWERTRAEDGSDQAVLNQPALISGVPRPAPVPARALGIDTKAILQELGLDR